MSSPVKFTVTAPGKIILFGEHSVVYGKRAVATSINKKTSLIFETISSDKIKLKFVNLNLIVDIPVDLIWNSSSPSFPVDEEYNAPVVKDEDHVVLLRNEKLREQADKDVNAIKNLLNLSDSQSTSLRSFFFVLRGLLSDLRYCSAFEMTVSSELCMGAGTGSSASFSVCLSAALHQYRRFLDKVDNWDSIKVGKQTEIINQWALCCEQIIHGKASGIDNYICTYGSAAEMVRRKVEEKEEKVINMLPHIPNIRILLINTGISRSTSRLVEKVAQLREKYRIMIDSILNAMGEMADRACTILQLMGIHDGDVSGPDYAKLFSQLEEIIRMNQAMLVGLDVSHESLDNIVSITRKFKLHTKLTGAGGGGYAVTFVPPYIPETEIQNCIEILKSHEYAVDDVLIGVSGVSFEKIVIT